MPTFGQGAPGVRIRLRDASAVNLVTNPRITAGIVGYSSRGELNKIIDLTSTAEQDTILGNGYNNPRFNQGLYAARAVINAGGFVEYVRPYGETINADEPNSHELKTDTFFVEYDFSSGAPTSFDISYYAATRYKTDGLATKGNNKREIYTISEALLNNTNVEFEIDATAGSNKVALFGIMNSDPTAATRAGDRFVISSIVVNSTIATVTTASPHGFSTGDTVTIAGTVNYNESDVVITVTSTTTFTYTSSADYGTETSGAVFKNEDTAESGVDYLSIKTVATGKATKKYDYIEIAGGENVITTENEGDKFTVVDSTNTKYTLEFDNDSSIENGNLAVTITNTTFTNHESDETIITVASGTGVKFLVGDAVTLTTTGTLPTGLTASTDYLVSAIDGDDIKLILNDGTGTGITITDDGTGTIINQTAILRNIATALTAAGYGTTSSAKIVFDGKLVDDTNNLIKLSNGYASKFSIDDYVMFSDLEPATGREEISDLGLDADTIYQIASVNIHNDTIGLKDATTGDTIDITGVASNTLYRVINLTTAKVSATVNDGNKKLRLDIVGKFGLNVPSETQDDATSFVSETDDELVDILTTAGTLEDIAATTDSIVLDDAVGRTFLSLGLAVEDYQDIDFDGDQDRVFILTADGESVARIFLIVEYYFGGETYNFSGTIVPYVYNDLNLDIKEQATNVANGWKFVINENISLENAILDSKFDLSHSLYENNIESEFVQVAFNAEDPAIVNDAIWEYDPRNNNGSVMLGEAWKLFLNKDEARADMFIAAGTAISNLFVKNMEAIDYDVMDKMLDICEKRKDCFAIFDGVDEKKIDTALRKMVGIGSQGDRSRWGSLFDGRSIFFDSVYTKLNVEAVKSIEVAAIITLNRAANVYWLPPAGYETGRIPAALSSRQKYIRTYNYADDPTSDIARLYDANINPTRVNDQGQFIYGQKTMLKRITALNRLNVIMLVAGIHKRFADFLDRKVFQLNTPALRNGITAELQAQLELIKSANPAGLTEGVCICDDTNNTADIIDTNQLIVDIFLQPTRTAEFITLRTTVQRTGDTASIVSAQLIGG